MRRHHSRRCELPSPAHGQGHLRRALRQPPGLRERERYEGGGGTHEHMNNMHMPHAHARCVDGQSDLSFCSTEHADEAGGRTCGGRGRLLRIEGRVRSVAGRTVDERRRPSELLRPLVRDQAESPPPLMRGEPSPRRAWATSGLSPFAAIARAATRQRGERRACHGVGGSSSVGVVQTSSALIEGCAVRRRAGPSLAVEACTLMQGQARAERLVLACDLARSKTAR